MIETRKRDSAEDEQARMLIEGMKGIADGRISIAIDVSSFSGLWLEMARGVEEIRQLIESFYSELQVTNAQISSSREEIAHTVKTVDDLAAAFQDLRSDAARLEGNIRNLSGSLDAGQKAIARDAAAIGALRGFSADIDSVMRNANERLDSLLPVIGQTDTVLSHIDKINNHIKILSFNAAIEAARAGSQGSGFTVVAREMKRLSEQSDESVVRTGQINHQIKEELLGLVSGMSSSQNKIRADFSLISAEMEESISSQQQTVSSIVEDISDNQRQMQNYTRQLNDQFLLWKDALERLKGSTSLLEKMETALHAALSRASKDSLTRLEPDESVINGMIQDLQIISRDSGIRCGDPQKHRDILGAFLYDNHQGVEAIYSTNDEGAFIFSQPAAGLANARIRPWWSEAIAGRIYRSAVYISAITRKPCLTISLAFYDAQDRPAGVLGLDLTV